MNNQFANVVYPVIAHALRLKERLDEGESADIEAEQRELLEKLRPDGESRRLGDFNGDGSVFLGARYALVCWIDELFIVHSPWSDLWNERKLEVVLYGTLVRAGKFWDQLDVALKRPNTPRPPVPPGPDALETFFLCVVLGFRGRYLNDPSKVREYVEEIRPQISRTGTWQTPRDLGVQTNVEPLTGKQTLRRIVWVYGGISLVVLLGLLILGRFLLI